MIKSIFLKKAVFVISAFAIFLQIIFLLETGNNSIAQTGGTIIITPSVQTLTDPYKKLMVTVSPSGTILTSVHGFIRQDGPYGITVINDIPLTFNTTTGLWTNEFNYSTSNPPLVNGVNYYFCASGQTSLPPSTIDGCSTSSFNVNNSACLLTVSLSPNTPPAQNVSSGQTGVPLVKFNLLPNCAMTLNNLAISLLPYPNGYSNIYSLRLYKDGTQMGSVSVTGPNVNFTGLNIPIPASQTIVFEIKGDISTSATAGSTFYGVFGGYSQTGAPGPVEDNTSGNIFAGNIMTITGYTGDMILPTMPTGLVATKDDYNEVDLSWTASTDNVGVAGYKIWRSNGTWINLGSSSTTTYKDMTVASGTGYYYKITAYDAAGNESTPSTQLFLNTPATSSSPLPPPSVIASSSAGKIIVSWPMSTSAGTYSIHRKVNNGSYQPLYSNITSLYYHDLSVTAGSTYQYKVLGCNATTCSTTEMESNSVTYSGSETSCTGLTLTLNDGKTTYTIGDTINYTWTCYPSGSSSNVSMRLYKPDSTSALYDSASGNTRTTYFGTSNLVPGTYNLKACFDTACTTINASQNFSLIAGTTTTPTFTISTQISDITSIPPKKLLKVFVVSTPTNYNLTSAMGKITNSAGTTLTGSPFNLTYQTGGYWSREYDISGLASGNYYFCAKGFYNTNEIPWSCNPNTFSVSSTSSSSSSGSNVSIYPDFMNSTGTFKTMQVTVLPTGTNLYNVTGKIRKDSAYGVVAFENISLPFDPYSNSWRKEFDTGNLANGGNYVFCAKASLDSTGSNMMPEVCTGTFTVNNETATIPQLEVYFQNVTSTPIKGDVKIAIKTNIEPDIINFKIQRDLGASAFPPAIKVDATNFYFLWNTGQYYDGNYTIYATAKKGTIEKTSSVSSVVANYSSSTTEPFTLTFVESFASPISGDRNISVSANRTIDSCKFKVEGLRYAEFPGTSSNSQCSFVLHSRDFPDGKYMIRALAANGTNAKEIILNTAFLNQMDPAQQSPLQPLVQNTDTFYLPQECKDKGYTIPEECQKYMQIPPECRNNGILDAEACKAHMYKYGMPPECADQGVQTPEECQKIIFLNSMPMECKSAGAKTKEECDIIMSVQFMLTPECKNANITAPDACNKYMIDNFLPPECDKEASQEECNFVIRNSYNTFNNLAPQETNRPFNIMQNANDSFPPECKEAGITSPDECRKHMTLLSMPSECREANAATEKECKKIMFEKYGPKECIEADILDPSECEKFMFKKYAPEDCKKAGLFNPEACKKFMFEKYSGKENTPQDRFPIECQKANVNTSEECDKVMKTLYMPEECKDKGITDQKECDRYFEKKYMPTACKEAGASTREECDKVMFKKYSPKECQKAGIENDEECQKFMFNLYAPKVKCDNLEDWQCKKSLGERHMGDVVSKQVQFAQIKERSNEMIGKSMKVKDLMESRVFENNNMIPLSNKDTSLKMVSATENMVLNDEDTLIQTGPMAFMVDSDRDSLSDDMEILLGTDPNEQDTDKDGYNDGDELRTGHDPLGPGLFTGSLSPTEKAMIENTTLGHPKTSGETSDNLAVEEIKNLSDINENNDMGYLLSGQSEAGSIVTLYIYSDMPLVLTVKANTEGNWEYTLDKPLSDGEHEVYVVVNDETGKVVSKSKPSSLFVKQAKAVSANEFVNDSANTLAEKTPEEITEIKYNSIMFLSILAGLSIFGIILLLRKRKKTVKK